MVKSAKLRLLGHCPSKKNSWARRQGGGMYIPAEFKTVIDALQLQAQAQWKREPIETCMIKAMFIVRDARGDLDGKMTTLLDVLVKAGVIRNDSIKHVSALSVEAVVIPEHNEGVAVEIVEI